MKNFESLRREYGTKPLNEDCVAADPFLQFQTWFDEILASNSIDPSAMTLATVDTEGKADARIVLLKSISREGFVFYTNYESSKALQIASSPDVALLFYWPEWNRQVRIKGTAVKTSQEDSKNYFSSRPRRSQIAATVSKQSAIINNREILEKNFEDAEKKLEGHDVPCPKNWGGYCVIPAEVEFFQGRDSRLHDRLRYKRENNTWKIERLSP